MYVGINENIKLHEVCVKLHNKYKVIKHKLRLFPGRIMIDEIRW